MQVHMKNSASTQIRPRLQSTGELPADLLPPDWNINITPHSAHLQETISKGCFKKSYKDRITGFEDMEGSSFCQGKRPGKEVPTV